jgi:hypothetical protein
MPQGRGGGRWHSDKLLLPWLLFLFLRFAAAVTHLRVMCLLLICHSSTETSVRAEGADVGA